MCGIAGFCNLQADFTKEHVKWHNILSTMRQSMMHFDPDDEGEALFSQAALAHTRLSTLELNRGHQPMKKNKFGNSYTIVYNGELYNTAQLRDNLIRMGFLFKTYTDSEVILTGFMAFGTEFVKEMNGCFSFAIWDDNKKSLYLFRDRLGIKPLFFTLYQDTFVFASEIKALFQYPGIQPRIGSKGLCEIFGLGPAKSSGYGVFQDIFEVLPGHFIRYDKDGIHEERYWGIISAPHEESYEETVEKVSNLLKDSVLKRLYTDKPLCALLTDEIGNGSDPGSALVSAICEGELSRQDKLLETRQFHCAYSDLSCTDEEILNNLFLSVDAGDLPNITDTEDPLYCIFHRITPKYRVALTGVGADEVFGDNPWFHNPELMALDTFPWSRDMELRKELLSQDLLSSIDLDQYVHSAYEKSIAETPRLPEDSKKEARRRELAYVSLTYYLPTLLGSIDRSSSYCGLETRFPFADHRLIEYVWNVHWDMKCPNGVAGGLLLDAAKALVPGGILHRRTPLSAYPQTYHSNYEKKLGNLLLEIMANPNAPLRPLLDEKKIRSFLSSPANYSKPWFGQRMYSPQFIAYLLQVNYWLAKYNIQIL